MWPYRGSLMRSKCYPVSIRIDTQFMYADLYAPFLAPSFCWSPFWGCQITFQVIFVQWFSSWKPLKLRRGNAFVGSATKTFDLKQSTWRDDVKNSAFHIPFAFGVVPRWNHSVFQVGHAWTCKWRDRRRRSVNPQPISPVFREYWESTNETSLPCEYHHYVTLHVPQWILYFERIQREVLSCFLGRSISTRYYSDFS